LFDFTDGANRITVDGSGNVGIGTTSPETNLHIEDGSSYSLIRLVASTASVAGIDFGDADDRDIGRVRYNNSDDSMVFHTNAAEQMRIDSSGDLIVGGTSSGANDAVSISNTGYIQAIINGDTAAYFNRRTSDGEIVRLQKDGTRVGSIGVNSSRPYLVNSVDGGIHVGTDGYGRALLLPADQNGAPEDNLHYLGSSSYRWRDLYLSGKISTNSTTGLSIAADSSNRGILNLSASTAYQLIGGTYYGYTGYKTGGYHRWFGSDGVEDMRLDSSGNLLVGQTSNSETGTGIGLVPDGTSHMYSGSTDTLMLGRGGTDGEILSFNKSGTTVGSIGASGGLLVIGDSDCGIAFEDGTTNHIYPWNVAGGAANNDGISLGANGAAFKDLHLSGTVNAATLNISGGAVINESSADQDFRVESDGNSHALFVNAGNENVSIKSAGYTTTTDLNLLGAGLSIKNDKNGSSNNWSLIQNTAGGSQSNFEFITGAGSALTLNHDRSATFGSNVTSGGHLALSQTGSFAETGLTYHTNDWLYARGGVNGIILKNRASTIEMMRIKPTEVVVNDDGIANLDFRVESDGSTHMLFVEAASDCVSIGSSSDKGATLNIEGNVRRGGYTTLSNFNSNNDVLAFNYNIPPSSTTVTPIYSGVGVAGGAFIHMESGGGGTLDFRAAMHGTDGSAFAYGDAGKYLTLRPTAKSSGELVVNQDGQDIDFRVESDGNSHALFVDAGNSRVGINNATPNYTFDVSGNVRQYGGTTILGSSSGDPGVLSLNDNSTTAYTLNFKGTGTRVYGMEGSASSGNYTLNMSNAGTGLFALTVGGYGSFTQTVDTGATVTIGGHQNGRLINFQSGGVNRFYLWGQATGEDYLDFRESNNDSMLRMYDSAGVVINEDSTSQDFRVESDAHTHALFVDASRNMVAVDTSDPDYLLDVGNGTSSPAGGKVMRINSSGDTIFTLAKQTSDLFSIRNNTTAYTALSSNNGAGLMLGYGTGSAGAINDHQFFSATETSFNNVGADRDFRVESNDYSSIMYVNAGQNYVQFFGTGLSDAAVGHDFRANGQATFVCNSTARGLQLNNISTSDTQKTLLFQRNTVQRGSVEVGSSGVTYLTTSDRRLKKDIETITDGTDKLMAMNPVTHGWKADPEADAVHGFIAQEMMDIVPEAVAGDPESDEMMSMDYGRITPVIVAALQDAIKEIQELKTRINELEGK
jgi:hypothetical protein